MRTYTFENIPLSLQQVNRWVVWRDVDGAKVPFNAYTGHDANPLWPGNHLTFANACSAASHFGCGIGLVFDGSDRLVFIDFDNKFDDPELVEMHNDAIKRFDTYTEVSPSGKGYHLIALGFRPDAIVLPKGVEIYDKERFATFTGWSINGADLREAQYLLDQLPRKDSKADNIGDAGVATSALDVLSAEKALAAECNNVIDCAPGTFNNTLNNAAFALGTFVGAGTLDADRVAAALYAAALQARPEKGAEAQKTITSGLRSGIARPRASLVAAEAVPIGIPSADALAQARMTPEQSAAADAPTPVLAPSANLDSLLGGHVFRVLPAPGEPFQLRPLPGLLGQIEDYLIRQSTFPYPMAAHVGALAWMAGVTGLTYGIKSDGQNLYMILTAPTSTGKTATMSGLARLNNMIENGHPSEHDFLKFAAMKDFVFPSHVTAPQSLLKLLHKSFSGYTWVDEVDRNLKAMLGNAANDLERGKKQLLMTLFDASGKYARIDGMQYSKAENTIEGTGPRSFTYLGMSTPDKLYEVIGRDEIRSGFINRFMLLNGPGGGAYNHDPEPIPDINTVQLARSCAAYCAQRNSKGERIEVMVAPDAEVLRRALADEALELGRAMGETFQGMLGRVERHATRMASVLATAYNSSSPVVTVDMLQYTIRFVMDGVWAVLRRFVRGETGVVSGNQTKQEDLLWDVIRETFSMSITKLRAYGLTPEMIKAKTLTRRSVHIRIKQLEAFYGDRFGASMALDRVVSSMVANGEIEILQGRTRNSVIYKVLVAVN